MLLSEIILMTIFTGFFAILILIILENFKTPIPHILKYFRTADYILITFTMLLVIGLMTRNFTDKIFKVSVISSLKGIEQ
jgi:hypothetical protein